MKEAIMRSSKITPQIYKDFESLFDSDEIKNAPKVLNDIFSNFNLTTEEKEFLANFIFKVEQSSLSKGLFNIASRKKISLTCGDYVRLNIIQKKDYNCSIFSWEKELKLIVIANAPHVNEKFELSFASDMDLIRLYQSLTFYNSLLKAKLAGKFNNRLFSSAVDIYNKYIDALTEGNYNELIELLKFLPTWVEDVNQKDMESWNKTYAHNENWAILFGLFSKELINISIFNKYSKLVSKITRENLKSRLIEEIKLRRG